MSIVLILLIVFSVFFVLMVTIYLRVKNKIENFSNSVFGTKNILDGFKKQELELSNTPKSVASMDSVEIPKIQKDFPNLDINEIKSMAQDAVLLYYKSLEKRKAQEIFNGTEKLKHKMQEMVEHCIKENTSYSHIKIHRTVINSYKKSLGMCIIVVQSSLEYILNKDKKVQDRVNTELIYVYDNSKLSEEYGISLNCKNCGAPIKELGNKYCPYCGTGVVITTSKVWKIDDIKNV